MSWRERLQAGNFRGTAFHTEQASGNGGRRVALHEYPQQENYFAEDLGKKAETERLRLFVLGDDYDKARDALMTALKKPGSGKLVHPYLGTLMIQVQDFDWTISTKRGGYCEFNVQYVRAGKVTPPTTVTNKGKKVSDATSPVSKATQNGFVSNFTVDDTAAFVEVSAIEKLNDFVSSIRAVNGQIAGYLQPISTVAAIIDDLGTEIAALILQPANLVSSLISVVASVFGAIDDIKVALKGYNHLLAGFGSNLAADTREALSINRKQEAKNAAALNVLIVSAATIAAANAIVTIQSAASSDTSNNNETAFKTLTEAQTARDVLLETIDSLIDAEVSDNEYYAWVDLQAALVQYISEIEPNLATSNTLQLAESVPSLVLAYRLYGDAERESELVSRNAIAHPTFMPTGVDLEVLS